MERASKRTANLSVIDIPTERNLLRSWLMFAEGSDSLSAKDDFYYAAVWWGEALNPVQPLMNPAGAFTSRGISQKAAAATIAYSAAWIVSGPMSGGGSQAFIDFYGKAARPTARQMGAMKIDSYRAIASGAGRTMGFLARRAIPAITWGTVLVAGAHMADSLMRSLTDGMTGLLPDANFMNWHGF
jgi:hypothetical protein